MLKLNNIRMKPKLLLLFLIAGLLPLSIVGIYSAVTARNALMEKSYAQLESMRNIKKRH